MLWSDIYSVQGKWYISSSSKYHFAHLTIQTLNHRIFKPRSSKAGDSNCHEKPNLNSPATTHASNAIIPCDVGDLWNHWLLKENRHSKFAADDPSLGNWQAFASGIFNEVLALAKPHTLALGKMSLHICVFLARAEMLREWFMLFARWSFPERMMATRICKSHYSTSARSLCKSFQLSSAIDYLLSVTVNSRAIASFKPSTEKLRKAARRRGKSSRLWLFLAIPLLPTSPSMVNGDWRPMEHAVMNNKNGSKWLTGCLALRAGAIFSKRRPLQVYRSEKWLILDLSRLVSGGLLSLFLCHE